MTLRYNPVELTTDKVRYEPGNTVVFTSKNVLPANAKVRYLHGNTVVKTDEIGGKQRWDWKVPADNFTGYMAENGGQHMRIGLDLTSGFLVYQLFLIFKKM